MNYFDRIILWIFVRTTIINILFERKQSLKINKICCITEIYIAVIILINVTCTYCQLYL